MARSKDGNASSKKGKCKATTEKKIRQKAKKRARKKVEVAIAEIQDEDSLPFERLLGMERIVEVLHELGHEYRERVYSPWVTTWAFLSHVTSKDASAKSVVTRVTAYRALTGRGKCSPKSSSYLEARGRLPEAFYATLARGIGQDLDTLSPNGWLWKGRHVKIVDGTTVTMEDTAANQAVYPQSSNQKPGLGYPLARITALFSLGVGTILDAEITGTKGKKTGEITAFRELWRSLEAGDVVLADCLYDGYSDIARLRHRQVDVVFGMSQSRARDFRTGIQLGTGDHIVEWKKPKFNRSRFTREEWEALPDTLQMREVTTRTKDAKGKWRTITLVTTLLDAKQYSKEDILNLFRERWHCELDLRCVKTMMGMEHLNSRTPETVRKQMWTYFMAYNLIRTHMANAAQLYETLPRKLSFNNARQAIQTYSLVVIGVSATNAAILYDEILHTIASERVGKRLGRSEPRKLKRRKGKFPYLKAPRPKSQPRAA